MPRPYSNDNRNVKTTSVSSMEGIESCLKHIKLFTRYHVVGDIHSGIPLSSLCTVLSQGNLDNHNHNHDID